MGEIYETLPDAINEADVIIVGGGTAGCVVAGRLAEADTDLSILVIEQGPNNLNVPTIAHPALFMSGILPTSNHTLFYQGSKESQLGGRELIVPSGGTLGGGSSINFMMYSRAQRSDFDSWNVPGWSAEEMIPYLKKLETYHGPGSRATHGFDGPINVSGGTYRVKRSESDYIQAAGKVGYPEVEDLASLDANNGIQRALRYIGTDGTRQDVASRYVHPKIESRDYPNLHVVVNSQVKRIIFENKRACGVEYRPNSKVHPDGVLRVIRARKLVVVSSGALGSPSILERSGLGNPELLKRVGIDVLADLPGEDETIDAVYGGRLDIGKLIQENAAILGWNMMDTTCKIRPTEVEVSALGPDFQAMWNKDYKNEPNKPIALGSLISGFPGDPSLVPAGQYMAMSVFTGYPLSRGSIHISGPECDDKPNFTTGFLSDAHNVDIKKHVWAYKKQREIFRRMKTYRGELAIMHPPFAPDSGAALVQLDDKPSLDIEDIVYTLDDEKVIEDYVRTHVETTWHSLGTCKMGPRETRGVVDSLLNVYGVEGLKIVDLSIPPRNVAANTMNTAVAIAEKAADIIARELSL